MEARTRWSQGTTSRPLRSCTPWQGPVAYQVHSGRLTSREISTGADQVRPSSALRVTHTVRSARPLRIRSSPPSAGFLHSSSQTVPVRESTTGAGLPTVIPGSVATTCASSQVRPPSVLRRSRVSISPASARLCLRPSQNASTVPLVERVRAGMR